MNEITIDVTNLNSILQQVYYNYQNRQEYDNVSILGKEDLRNNSDLKKLRKYFIGDRKTLYFDKISFNFSEQNYQKDFLIDNLKDETDSVIFFDCCFNCNSIIQPYSDKFSFVIFVNCNFQKKLSIGGRIQNYVIIEGSEIREELLFSEGSFVKKEILLNESSIKKIFIDKNFTGEKILINSCRIFENIHLNDAIVNKIKLSSTQLRGNFENEKPEVQNGDFRQIIEFYKTDIDGNINLIYNRIESLRFEDVSTKGNIKSILYGKNVKLGGNTNSFKYFSFGGSIDGLHINCKKINGQLLVEDALQVKNIYLENTDFNDDINLKTATISTFIIDENSVFKNIYIGNSKIGRLDIQKASFQGSLNCLNIEFNYIRIAQSTFDRLLLNGLENNKATDFQISRAEIRDSFILSNVNLSKVEIRELLCLKSPLLLDSINANKFEVVEIIAQEGIIFNNNCKIKEIEFWNFYGTSLILNNTLIESNKISFWDCHIDEIFPFGFNKMEYNFNNCKIEKLEMKEITSQKDVIFSFINCFFCKIDLSHFNNIGNLFFRTVRSKTKEKNKLKSIEANSKKIEGLKDFNFERDYNFFVNWSYDIYNPTVIFNQSSLGKTEFADFDFAGFDFQYNNSKITEAFISGGSLPKSIQIYDIDKKDNPIEYYKQEVGAYNQFKKIFDSQGDNFQSTYFQAKAAESQAQLLGYQKDVLIAEKQSNSETKLGKIKQSYKVKFFSHNAFERFTFWLNNVSNRHGESWIVALRFILIISILSFNLYVLLNDEYHYKIDFNIKDFEKIFGDYVSFLDLTQKPKEGLNGWAKGVLFVSKIFIGYGIFQLIAAFRKHGKKS